MAFDEDRGVVVCDLWGCWDELPIPPGERHVNYVMDHPEWTHRDGLYRCPRHPLLYPWERNPWRPGSFDC